MASTIADLDTSLAGLTATAAGLNTQVAASLVAIQALKDQIASGADVTPQIAVVNQAVSDIQAAAAQLTGALGV